MYSKARGHSQPPRREPTAPRAGSRYPGDRHVHAGEPAYRRSVTVPPNYRGNAIVDGEERLLGSVSDPRETPAPPLLADAPHPTFEDLPRVSELGNVRRRTPVMPLSGEYTHSADPSILASKEEGSDVADTGAADGDAALVSADPAPAAPRTERGFSWFDPSHFPFGHGFGFDELLLLGLILFLLRENGDQQDRGDLDETLILLGLLLLGG